MNLFQKLEKIRKPVEILQKNKSGYGYKYVTEDVILAKIKGLMDRFHVSLIPKIIPGTTEVNPYTYTKTKRDKAGNVFHEENNEILFHADMEWVWVNNEKPDEVIRVPWTIVGQQSDASQAFGSGLSYSSRYFLLKYFNCSTSEDDPDAWRARQKEAEEEEDRLIAKDIIEQVNDMVTSYVQKVPEDRTKIGEIVKKFASGRDGKPTANYNVIKDSKTASELMNALNAFLTASSEKNE